MRKKDNGVILEVLYMGFVYRVLNVRVGNQDNFVVYEGEIGKCRDMYIGGSLNMRGARRVIERRGILRTLRSLTSEK